MNAKSDIEYLRGRLDEYEPKDDYSTDTLAAYIAVDVRIVKALLDDSDKIISLQAKCDALAAENSRMDKFVDECLQAAWEGGSLDGGEVQDIGVKNDLLREETYSADQHENLVEDPSNFEDGDAIYFRTEMTGTDAAIAEIKAQGVDELIQSLSVNGYMDESEPHIQGEVVEFAANLRAGRKG